MQIDNEPVEEFDAIKATIAQTEGKEVKIIVSKERAAHGKQTASTKKKKSDRRKRKLSKIRRM